MCTLASRVESFEAFREEWLARQERLVAELERAKGEEQQRRLIERVLCQYQEFLEEKSALADADVFLLFSAPWLSACEKALLWIGDYRPSLILHLLDAAVQGLSPEQRESLHRLRSHTRRAQRDVSEAMASLQETIATPPMLGFLRLLHGHLTQQDPPIHGLKEALKNVSHRADELRADTMRTVVEILSPPQTVQLLAATIKFQMRLRNLDCPQTSLR